MKWVLAVFVCTIAFSGCRKTTQPPVVGGPSLADTAEQVLFDVHTMLTDHGVKRGDMYADTVYVFNDQTKFVMRRVRATFNTTLGAPNGTLKGDRGTYDLRAQVLEGFGNVVVTSTDGRQLTSNHLKYMQGANLVSTDSAYTLVRGNDVSRGIGFSSDPNLNSFKCFRACSGSALVPIQTLPSR
jgi:LPS export ABC transporter protein LptC